MKIHRSTKNLKPVDPHIKQQSQLRMKVKLLQQQVSMLQKSNLNIFIPISQHTITDNTDYQSIITKLRQQILQLQHQSTIQKNTIKKIQKQKLENKQKYEKQLSQKQQKINQLFTQKQQIQQQLIQTQQKYQQQIQKCQQLDKKIIQKNVQLKFVHQDLKQQRIRKNNIQKQLKDIKGKIGEVIFGTKIYKSLQIKCICIQKSQYDQMRNRINQLQQKIRVMIQTNKREKITLGTQRSDIGQQIVRLKRNIDLQLGIQGNSKHSQQFLKIYRGTQDLFTQLLQKCKV